jgi:hypothetical protein
VRYISGLKPRAYKKMTKKLRKRRRRGKPLFLNFIIFDDKHESDMADLEAPLV